MALKHLSPGQVYLPTDMPVLVDFIDRERLLEMRDGVWRDALAEIEDLEITEQTRDLTRRSLNEKLSR